MTPEIAAKLREPFPPEKIGKLPRVTCGDCRDSRGRTCDKHPKSRCDECGSYITSAHMHLDFVGHADVTDRLLESDPAWSWEPFALDPRGLPAMDENGGMWIRLTVGGVTRIGYGDADGKRGGNAVKETIGDSLRNAALRFGVALDLWRKETHVDESTGPRQERKPDGWDQAKPAKPTREQVIETGHKAIASAQNKAMLDVLTGRVSTLVQDGTLTTDDGASMMAAIKGREVELAAAALAAEPPVNERQHKRMHALWREVELGGPDKRDDRLAFTSRLVGRRVTSSAELTQAEADKVIAGVEAHRKSRAA